MRGIPFLILLFILFTISVMNGSGAAMAQTGAFAKIEAEEFQTTLEGTETGLFTLKNGSGMEVAITNYGGRIVRWLVPDAGGERADIVLGFDSISGYLSANEIYFGALIGRYANRIQGGQFSLEGTEYSLPANDGPNHLHGGPGGFHNVVWEAGQPDEQNLVLHYASKDGEEGYPGNLEVSVRYTLTDHNELKIKYTASADEATPLNLTNHAFFNLGGAASGTINDHQLMIEADSFTPVDSTLIPTGEIAAVEDTPFDFREAKPIGEDLSDDDQQLHYGEGYDHNFVLNKEASNQLSKAAEVYDPDSGRLMEVFTTEPGLQFYGGNFLDGSDAGKEGVSYEHRSAFCLETQHFPDSPNQPEFPSTILKPGETYRSLTIYRLSAR